MARTRQVYRKFAAAIAAPLLVASAACGGGDDAAADSAGAMAMSDSTGAMNMPNNAGAADAPVAQLLATVNRGEIDAGKLAGTKARNADVKAFARQMVDEHQRAMQTLSTLASSTGWSIDSASVMSGAATGATTGNMAGSADTTGRGMAGGTTGGMTQGGTGSAPALVSTVSQMQQMNAASMQELKSRSGAAFDRTYMDAQIAGHQQVLDLLRQYSNSVQNNDLRSHVSEVQGTVEKHLQEAKDIRGKLGGTTGAGS